jgi:hypothetical protein
MLVFILHILSYVSPTKFEIPPISIAMVITNIADSTELILFKFDLTNLH